MNLTSYGYNMTLIDIVIAMLIIVLPLVIVLEPEIKSAIQRVKDYFKSEDKEDTHEHLRDQDDRDYTIIDGVYKVEKITSLECYDGREIVRINGSYQSVEANRLQEDELVYVGNGYGIRSLTILNRPSSPMDVEPIAGHLYQTTLASGYRKIARLSEDDLRGRYNKSE